MVYEEVLDALDIIEEHSITGRRLLAWADRMSIPIESIAFTDDKSGECQIYANGKSVCYVSDTNSLLVNIQTIPHELMHSMQWLNTYRYAKRVIANALGQERAAISLALEAAAETLAIKVLHEITQSTVDDSFWSPQSKEYESLFDAFDRAYQSELRRGVSNNRAIQKACDVTYKEYFNNRDICDIYNNESLADYIEDTLRHPTPFAGEFCEKLSFIDATTLFNTDPANPTGERLISHPLFPVTSEEVFGHDGFAMRKAFEYVDCIRHMRAFSDFNSSAAKRNERHVRKAFNQFIGVDLDVVHTAIKKGNVLDSLKIMMGYNFQM